MITAWQHISPSLAERVFKNCCISSAVTETNGNMLWNGSEEVGDHRNESEEIEDIDGEDGDSDTDL
jgi:hypothetical protein